MRDHDQQGTSFETNRYMLGIEVKKLFSKNWREARVGHKLLNIFVELIRANPKFTFWVIAVLLFMVVGQTAKLIT